MIKLTHKDITTRTLDLSRAILATSKKDHYRIYGVPKGGIPVAYMLSNMLGSSVVESPEDADIIVDDLVDSGATKERYQKKFPNTPFYALYTKGLNIENDWIQFPWEVGENDTDSSADDIPTRLLQYIGEDVNRGGLLETPKRYLKAWREITTGYNIDPKSVLKVFEDGASDYGNNMVLVKNIDIYSVCEHHLLPFFGTANVAYIPNIEEPKIIGLSKIHRLCEVFSRRLQVQERLTTQIANILEEELNPLGVAVSLSCRHMCVEMRGIKSAGTHTVTSSMKGVFLDNKNNARSEFLELIRLPQKTY